MNKVIRKFLLNLSPFVIIALFIFGYHLFKTFFSVNTSFESENFKLYIEPNSNFDELKSKLETNLKSTYYFSLAAQNKGYYSRVKSGLFIIPKESNNNEIINILRSESETVSVIFNNNERLENLAGRVSKQVALDSTLLLNVFYNKIFLASNGFNFENAISMYLPNTYDFYWDTSAENFRNKMLESYNIFWNKSRMSKAKKIDLTQQEVSVLASIVQRESVMKDERPRIAGVYLNRLKKRMRLQADPTVIFALKNKSGDFSKKIRRVLYKDLRMKSPYNTYRNRGLPPGPICMPDLDAIDAVLNSENHNFLYFVADPENRGYHLFGKNLREHNTNKKKYINWINKKKIYR